MLSGHRLYISLFHYFTNLSRLTSILGPLIRQTIESKLKYIFYIIQQTHTYNRILHIVFGLAAHTRGKQGAHIISVQLMLRALDTGQLSLRRAKPD